MLFFQSSSSYASSPLPPPLHIPDYDIMRWMDQGGLVLISSIRTKRSEIFSSQTYKHSHHPALPALPTQPTLQYRLKYQAPGHTSQTSNFSPLTPTSHPSPIFIPNHHSSTPSLPSTPPPVPSRPPPPLTPTSPTFLSGPSPSPSPTQCDTDLKFTDWNTALGKGNFNLLIDRFINWLFY